MQKRIDLTNLNFDWDHARTFLGVAKCGTLTQAAQMLGKTQPTIGHQIAAFEYDLDMILFDRVGRSLHLTHAGASVVDILQRMKQAALDLERFAKGHQTTLDGVVRLTASDVVSAFDLPDVLHRVRQRAPALRIEIIASNDLQDLLRREADIAIRHVRPEQPDLVARKVATRHASLYAAREYLDRFGTPQTLSDLENAQWVSMAPPKEMIAYMATHGMNLRDSNFGIVSENGLVGWEYARRGFGICIMSDDIAARFDTMVRLPDLFTVDYPVWLVAHRDLHHSPRMRLLFDLLADHLAQ